MVVVVFIAEVNFGYLFCTGKEAFNGLFWCRK